MFHQAGYPSNKGETTFGGEVVWRRCDYTSIVYIILCIWIKIIILYVDIQTTLGWNDHCSIIEFQEGPGGGFQKYSIQQLFQVWRNLTRKASQICWVPAFPPTPHVSSKDWLGLFRCGHFSASKHWVTKVSIASQYSAAWLIIALQCKAFSRINILTAVPSPKMSSCKVRLFCLLSLPASWKKNTSWPSFI